MPSSGKPIRDTNGEAGVGSLQLLLPGSASGHLAAVLPFTGTSQAAPGECLPAGVCWGGGSALPPVQRVSRGMTGALPVLAGSWGRLPRCGAGYYFTGDGAYRTEEGYYEITGRMDDVINISGHRVGTAEIEDALVSTAAAGLGAESESGPHLCVFCPAQADHPAVPETAVIGYPHDIKGEGASSTLRPWGWSL